MKVEANEYRDLVGMMETFRLRDRGGFWVDHTIIGLGEAVSL